MTIFIIIIVIFTTIFIDKFIVIFTAIFIDYYFYYYYYYYCMNFILNKVELLLSLQRIADFFAATTMSLQQTRPLDAVCIVVSGCIAAIADAVIRKIAVDEPSEVCSNLMGCAVNGRQLGHSGYGISVGSFATQSETLEIYTAELSIARTAILDYFQSPQQRRLEKIFSWEEEFVLKPGKNLMQFLRLICRETAVAISKPHTMICDANPISSCLVFIIIIIIVIFFISMMIIDSIIIQSLLKFIIKQKNYT
jgi:hypothetical protein